MDDTANYFGLARYRKLDRVPTTTSGDYFRDYYLLPIRENAGSPVPKGRGYRVRAGLRH